MELTPRQALILAAVVREHRRTRRPVGSRALVEGDVVDASASTIRAELGRLEELALLEHPHTSAGRVPTDAGYRYYVDRLSPEVEGRAALAVLDTVQAPARDTAGADVLGQALQQTTEALADATQLFAVATVPDAQGALIRHVEVLLAQPELIVVVVILSTGEVTKHVVQLAGRADPGLVEWAGAYLRERVVGLTLGQRLLRSRLSSDALSEAERRIVELLAPVFEDVVDRAAELRVGANADLLRQLGADVQQIAGLVGVLHERRRVLHALETVTGVGGRGRQPVVRIGSENELVELQPLSVVGARYGTDAGSGRASGLVGVIGPRAMDYAAAMVAVSAAAERLSWIVQELYG